MRDAAGSTETLRAHLEAIRDDAQWIIDTYWVAGGRSPLVQRAQVILDHAVAALDLLNAGELVGLDETEMVAFRLVADAVPDPAPRGDAEPLPERSSDVLPEHGFTEDSP